MAEAICLFDFVKMENRKQKIHRLVAEAYLPNPNNYDTVDHIDFNITNNCVNNLQWMSRHENSRKKETPEEKRYIVLKMKNL